MIHSLHSHSISPPHSSLLTLRNLATPLNPADINQIQGTYPALPPFTQALGTAQPCAVPGNEACFEVLSAGSGAKTVQKGDWVIARRTGLGTWRTHVQISEDAVVKITDKSGLTPLQVGTVSVNPVTAWRILRDFEDMREGDWWIQNGANSGVGRAALQLGKKWGLRSIAVVRGREDEKQQRALENEMKELGADIVVTEKEVAERGFVQRVKEWTSGGRDSVKLGLNCVGGDPGMQMAKVLGNGATLVTYGGMSRQPLRLGAAMLIFKDLRFRGFWVSKWSDANPEEKSRTVEEVLSMYREGTFKDVPYEEVLWNWDTKKEDLVSAAQGTLEGYRKGKGVFVFRDT